MTSPNQPHHSFTIKAKGGRLGVITMPVTFALPGSNKTTQLNGIWDTGASGTVISLNVVNALGLVPTGKSKVNTASEVGYITDTFIIDIS